MKHHRYSQFKDLSVDRQVRLMQSGFVEGAFGGLMFLLAIVIIIFLFHVVGAL